VPFGLGKLFDFAPVDRFDKSVTRREVTIERARGT
jgi:hypothetical protein